MKFLLLGIVLLLVVSTKVECGRVLVAAPLGTKSHQNTYVPLIKELAVRGHHLTLITNYRSKDLEHVTNIDQIEIEGLKIPPSLLGPIFNQSNLFDNTDLNDAFSSLAGIIRGYAIFKKWAINMATFTYGNPQVIQLLENATFDMVLVSHVNACTMYPLAWHFNASLAIFNVVRKI